MCHQRPERSFFVRGRQFPLCARCTGILCGYFVGIVTAVATRCANPPVYLILLLPMIADGGIQYKFGIESTNLRRFATGLLGGVGIVYLFVNIHIFTLMWVGKAISLFG